MASVVTGTGKHLEQNERGKRGWKYALPSGPTRSINVYVLSLKRSARMASFFPFALPSGNTCTLELLARMPVASKDSFVTGNEYLLSNLYLSPRLSPLKRGIHVYFARLPP